MLHEGGREPVEESEPGGLGSSAAHGLGSSAAHGLGSAAEGAPAGASPRRSPLVLVEALEHLVEELSSLDPAQTSGEAAAELSLRLHRAIDRAKAQQIGWIGRVEAESAWRGAGARSCKAWLSRTHDIAFHEAGKLLAAATAWRDTLPTTGAAARAGRVSTAKGALIAAAANTPDRIAALTSHTFVEAAPSTDQPESADGVVGPTGEEVLLGLADGYGVRDFDRITRRFAHVADPEADERGYRAALAREYFELSKTTGGYHLSGFLTIEHGQVLKTAMRAVSGVPSVEDSRTVAQRRAADVVAVGRLVLDKGLAGNVGTVRPHLSVHVSHTELEHLMHRSSCSPAAGGSSAASLTTLVMSPPAEWDDGTGPVPRTVLERIAADCEVTRVVFGPDSQVIDVGRTKRTFAGHLRRAVVARDRQCVVDGCGAPAFMGQVHHARSRWADGGVTRVDDGALVCGFHNQWLEDARVPMRRVRAPDGSARWQVGAPGSYRPDGSGRFPQDDPDHPEHVPDHVPRAECPRTE